LSRLADDVLPRPPNTALSLVNVAVLNHFIVAGVASRATTKKLAVRGDWDAGKSSVLEMTEATLAIDERTLCLWFNGWMFEGYEDAKTVVLKKIVTELKRARPTSTKVADAAKKLFKRIQWLKCALAGLVAFEISIQ
jgi:predicted KAP-like P-loop ATPase